MAVDSEAVVIGAGAVGLAVARALADRFRDVILIDRHRRTGEETSSRNSEVVHAGLYYPPGSRKALLCRSGARQLLTFADEAGVALARQGKLIVAAEPGELPLLSALAANARANGAHEVALLSQSEAQALEPQLACAGALWSPQTAVIDSRGYLDALEAGFTARGGLLALGTTVAAIAHGSGRFRVTTQCGGVESTIDAQRLVLSGGLHATALGRLLTYPLNYEVPEQYFAKGHYFNLKGPAPFQRLIYPLPGEAGLGIHYTRTVMGAARFGPDVAWVPAPDYRFEDAAARAANFAEAIRRYWPDVDIHRLEPDFAGVRPKLHGAGAPAQDFAIHGPQDHGIQGLIALYGIESPGLTASLALGEQVAQSFGGV